jgi:protocatechuate 3,4-dioxygenase beta subunit
MTGRVFAATPVPVIGGPCEGCEWVYDGLPATLTARSRIAAVDAPGAAMTLSGVVRSGHGAPVAGIVVYAYHTDHRGLYPPAQNRHGRLRGWTVTDPQGRYRFDTIRPAAYPGREIPEHVHMHVIDRDAGTYYIDDVRFTDDPLITHSNRRTAERGGSGLVTPRRMQGVWLAQRDIVLGLNL